MKAEENRFNLPMLDAFKDSLDAVEADESASAVVLKDSSIGREDWRTMEGRLLNCNCEPFGEPPPTHELQ